MVSCRAPDNVDTKSQFRIPPPLALDWGNAESKRRRVDAAKGPCISSGWCDCADAVWSGNYSSRSVHVRWNSTPSGPRTPGVPSQHRYKAAIAALVHPAAAHVHPPPSLRAGLRHHHTRALSVEKINGSDAPSRCQGPGYYGGGKGRRAMLGTQDTAREARRRRSHGHTHRLPMLPRSHIAPRSTSSLGTFASSPAFDAREGHTHGTYVRM